jgi:hypothetical protein
MGCSFQLANANQAIDPLCDNIFPGEVQLKHPRALFLVSLANGGPAQNLCLGLVGEDCDTVVPVQSGDSCSSIATAANITMATLIANNPNLNANCTNIYPGEVRFKPYSPRSALNSPTGTVHRQQPHRVQLEGTAAICARDVEDQRRSSYWLHPP